MCGRLGAWAAFPVVRKPGRSNIGVTPPLSTLPARNLAAAWSQAPCERPTTLLSHPMEAVFPHALQPLQEADPELFALVKAEEKRQW